MTEAEKFYHRLYYGIYGDSRRKQSRESYERHREEKKEYSRQARLRKKAG
jgi:hypothetical protein